MKGRSLAVAGAFEFIPESFPDHRGLFVSPFQEKAFVAATGHSLFPVRQSNHSHSRHGVVRGVHYTATPPGAAKYVYCARGRALDIVVDLRVGSPTFGKWDTTVLDPMEFRSMYFPVGVGHAFIALEDDTVMSYLLSSCYVASNELALSPMDPELALPVPRDPTPILSARDAAAPTLPAALAEGTLPTWETCREVETKLWQESSI